MGRWSDALPSVLQNDIQAYFAGNNKNNINSEERK